MQRLMALNVFIRTQNRRLSWINEFRSFCLLALLKPYHKQIIIDIRATLYSIYTLPYVQYMDVFVYYIYRNRWIFRCTQYILCITIIIWMSWIVDRNALFFLCVALPRFFPTLIFFVSFISAKFCTIKIHIISRTLPLPIDGIDYRKNILLFDAVQNVNSLFCSAIWSQSIFGRRKCKRPVGKSSVSQS